LTISGHSPAPIDRHITSFIVNFPVATVLLNSHAGMKTKSLRCRTQAKDGGAACVQEQVDGAVESGLIAGLHLLRGGLDERDKN
jgi:hypothetical protein